MKKLLVLIIAVYLFSVSVMAQSQPERRVIEVSGSAEQLITPNEFTFKITLSERMDGKRKITIEDQEASLRNELSRLGIDVAKDLSVFDLSSQYFRQRKLKDVLSTKDYRLKIKDLNKIAQLQDLADRINVTRLDLIDTDHSDIIRFREETKTEATKAAKRKAGYLLAGIGHRVGAAVYIKEVDEESSQSRSMNFTSNTNSRSNSFAVDGVEVSRTDGLSFAPIRMRFVIVAKFEIE
ncbi:MAG TPA: SIMPL domain-containing protein [Pyrinomonadaceae bacterium]|nr:SIMPL domain-containing protein [Pyrinomonadaceae bacterium]